MLTPEAETFLWNAFPKPDCDEAWSLARVSSVEQLVRFSERLMRDMRALGYLDGDLLETRLALEEALGNSPKHDHGSQPSQSVTIRYSLTRQRIVLEVEAWERCSVWEKHRSPSPRKAWRNRVADASL